MSHKRKSSPSMAGGTDDETEAPPFKRRESSAESFNDESTSFEENNIDDNGENINANDINNEDNGDECHVSSTSESRQLPVVIEHSETFDATYVEDGNLVSVNLEDDNAESKDGENDVESKSSQSGETNERSETFGEMVMENVNPEDSNDNNGGNEDVDDNFNGEYELHSNSASEQHDIDETNDHIETFGEFVMDDGTVGDDNAENDNVEDSNGENINANDVNNEDNGDECVVSSNSEFRQLPEVTEHSETFDATNVEDGNLVSVNLEDDKAGSYDGENGVRSSSSQPGKTHDETLGDMVMENVNPEDSDDKNGSDEDIDDNINDDEYESQSNSASEQHDISETNDHTETFDDGTAGDDNVENDNVEDNNGENNRSSISASEQLLRGDMENVVIAGKVQKIELENFMCHSNLKMRFNADRYNCFYIVGPNGSGKSAIFAALNIGLGGKGRSNNRGNTLASYIKEGESSAKIRVHLSNIGANRLSRYGDTIIVERVIRQSSTTFSLSTVDNFGKPTFVSTSKKELDRILNKFSIELENPLCWLSQDRAREFLQDMKPNKLYEIFMITSELCFVNIHHHSTAETLKAVQTVLDNWKEKHKTMKDNYENLKKVASASQKLTEFKSDLSKCMWISLWIPFKVNAQKTESINNAVASLQEDTTKLRENINARNNQSTEMLNSINLMQQNYDELNKEVVFNKVEIRRLKDIQDADSNKSRQIAAKVAERRSKVNSHENEIGEANKTLESILGRADRNIFAEKAEVEKNMKRAQEQLQQLKGAKDILNDQKFALESERRGVLESFQEYDTEIRTNRNDISKIDREKRDRERRAHDHMAKFGDNTTFILKCLNDNASNFKKKPIGPVGMFVKLEEKKWETGVEYVMKQHLKTYICDNSDDRKAFEDLLAKYKIPRVPIAIVNFSNQKYSIVEPDSNILTVARQVVIDDPTVFNYFVDNCKIDAVMLIEDEEEGREMMKTNPPRHISRAITLSASQIHPVKPNSPYRYYYGTYRARIFSDAPHCHEEGDEKNKQLCQENIKEAEKQKAELRKKEHEAKNRLADIAKEIHMNESEISKIERAISNFEVKIQQLDSIASHETLVENAKSTIEEITQMKLKDEEILKAFLKEQEENLALYEEHGKQIQEAVAKGKSVAEEMVEIEKQLKQAREKFVNFDEATKKFDVKLRLHERQILKHNEDKSQLLVDKGLIILNLLNAGKYEKPENLTDPPEFDDLISKDECERQISKLKTDIANLSRLNGGENITEEQLEAAKSAYEKAADSEKIYAKKLKTVESSFLERQFLFEKVKTQIPIKLSETFRELMGMRHYAGELSVDHDAKTIDIKVETHIGSSNLDSNEHVDAEDEDEGGRRHVAAGNRKTQRVVQDLRGLSGGERSYTTACFVMALWCCVESPFRCLDEFDVFMDMVNRKVIMELLNDLARKHKFIQFFFFTPQGVHDLDIHDVEVFTMPSAQR